MNYRFPEYSDVVNRVYDAVAEGNLTTDQLAQALPDVDPLTIGRYLRRLTSRGVLRRVYRGTYEVAA